MKSKKGFEFSFGWMFAIVIGAMIIFLSVYATTRLIGTERKIQESELGKELGIILTPIETSVEEGRSARILLSQETKLFNECDPSYGTFGSQDLSVSTEARVGRGESRGAVSSFRNKYIFSSREVEGREYRVFSKPFKFPFKIGDFIYMWSENEKYCFINPPGEIEEEIESLNLKGVNIVSDEKDCERGSKIVRIDIVTIGSGKLQGRVKKGFDEVYFVNPELALGAVFADPEVYECQVKRLMKRASELALLYRAKSVFLAPKGCGTNLEIDLERYANKTFSLEGSFDLAEIQVLSENLRRKNDELYCKIF